MTLLFASCVTEEPPATAMVSEVETDQAVEDARAWFGPQEEFEILPKNGMNSKGKTQTKKIHWNRTITHEDGRVIEVAVSYSNHAVPMREDTTRAGIKEKKERAFYRLLIRKDSLGNYSKSLLKFFPGQTVKDQSRLEVNNFMTLDKQFSGDIQLTDWEENLEKGWYVKEGIPEEEYFPEPNHGKKRNKLIGAALNCTVTTYQICDFAGDDDAEMSCEDGIGCTLPEVESYCYIVYSTSGCGNEGPGGPGWYNGGGGSGGGPTGPVPGGGPGGSNPGGLPTLLPDDEIVGIDCDSFNFKDVGSNWQEAGVLNVRSKVRLQGGGVRTMTINSALYFGIPKKLVSGETFSKVDAANFAASAVQRANDLSHQLYIYDMSTSETTVIAAFMSHLKSQMSIYGGRADYYGSGSINVSPTVANYVFLGNGICF